MIIGKKDSTPKKLDIRGKRFQDATKGYAGISEGIHHVSPSSIGALTECSHAFRLRREHRTVNLQTKLGSVVHAIMEDVAREFAFIDGVENITSAHRERYEEIKSQIINEAISDMFIGIELGKLEFNLDKIRPEIHDQVMDIELVTSLITHTANGLTLDTALETVQDGGSPIIVEAEVIGMVEPADLLFYGRVDMVKGSEDTRIVYVDDYKSVWSSQSMSNWRAIAASKQPTFQFWLYKELIKNDIQKYVSFDVAAVIPRAIVISFPEINIAKVLRKGSRTDLRMLVSHLDSMASQGKAIEVVIDIIPLPGTAMDGAFWARVHRAAGMLNNKLEVYAETKYGCNFCDYKKYCPLMKKLEEETDE